MQNSVRFPCLASAEILDGLDRDQAVSFIDSCKLRTFDVPTTIVEQYHPVGEVFIVAQGTVEVSFVSSEGYRSVIVLTGAGDTLCMLEALSNAPAVCTVKAFANTVIAVFDPEMLLDALNPELLLRNVARLAISSMKQDNEIRTIDKFYTAEQRICSYLSRLTTSNPTIRQDQSYLADIIGCSRQTLNKELGRLRDAQIIALSKGKIEVLNRPKLTQRIASLDTIR